jgi:predicted DNA-binding protein (UPF0278 family)
MNTDTFAKLKLATGIITRMTISDKIEYVETVFARLTKNMLTTSEGERAFSTENILSVALGAILTDTREEFEAICGFYRTGYRSALRDGLYNGRGDIPHSQWRKEIRMLYHNIKDNVDHIPLPAGAMY